MGLEAVGFGGGEKAHDGGGTLAGGVGAGEQPVLAPDGVGPDGVRSGCCRSGGGRGRGTRASALQRRRV